MTSKDQPVIFITPETSAEIFHLRNIVTFLILQNMEYRERAMREDRQRKILIHEKDNTARFKNLYNGVHGRGSKPRSVKLLTKEAILRT